MEVSIKGFIGRYPFAALIICFIIVLLSINQIISLTQTKRASPSIEDSVYLDSYSTVTTMAYKPNLSYEGFVNELSAKFPNQPDFGSKFNVTPDINKLPVNEQGNAIRLNILESKIEYLQRELNAISEGVQEPLILKLSFYFWGFLVWMGSVVIGRILEYWTDQFNDKYLRSTKS